jgi:hypothetical protein
MRPTGADELSGVAQSSDRAPTCDVALTAEAMSVREAGPTAAATEDRIDDVRRLWTSIGCPR